MKKYLALFLIATALVAQRDRNRPQKPKPQPPDSGTLASSYANTGGKSTGTGYTRFGKGGGGSSGGVFNTPGQGWFCGPGMMDYSSLFVNTYNAPITNYSSNTVVVEQFALQATWTLSKASYRLNGTGIVGSSFTFGIYDASGTKLIDSGAFNGNISTLQTLSFTSVTLTPGIYYFAASATSGSLTGPAMQPAAGPLLQMLGMVNGGTGAIIATAANSTSGGVLPATLGTLTPVTTVVSWQGIPLAIWLV